MLIDSHIHLYSSKFDADREEVLRRARDAGVTGFVLPAVDVESTQRAIALSESHADVWAMAAIHPSETKDAGVGDFEQVSRLCDHPMVVAVGESGLDYYWDRSFDDLQRRYLRRHIRLAIEKSLPLILHSRDKQGRVEVFEDLVMILKEEQASTDYPERLRGIFHCFSGPEWLPREAADLDFLLGIGGTLTFRNSGVAALVEQIPLSQMVLETDSPYLAPEPHRGKRNEPALLAHVAQRLADLKGIGVNEVARATSENARRLFGI